MRKRHVGWRVAFDNVGGLSRTDAVPPLGTSLFEQQSAPAEQATMTTMLIAMRGIIAWCVAVSLARIEVVHDAIGRS